MFQGEGKACIPFFNEEVGMRWIYFSVMVGVILTTMDTAQAGSTRVIIETSEGKIQVELNDKKGTDHGQEFSFLRG